MNRTMTARLAPIAATLALALFLALPAQAGPVQGLWMTDEGELLALSEGAEHQLLGILYRAQGTRFFPPVDLTRGQYLIGSFGEGFLELQDLSASIEIRASVQPGLLTGFIRESGNEREFSAMRLRPEDARGNRARSRDEEGLPYDGFWQGSDGRILVVQSQLDENDKLVAFAIDLDLANDSEEIYQASSQSNKGFAAKGQIAERVLIFVLKPNSTSDADFAIWEKATGWKRITARRLEPTP